MKKNLSSVPALASPRVSAGLALFALASVLALSGCTSRSLTGITVTPAAGLTTVAPGGTAQFHAIGSYSQGGHANTTQDITADVTWSSSVPGVATINSSGVATAVTGGTTIITATAPGEFGQLTATSSIVVTSPSGSGSGSGSGSSGEEVTRVLTGVNIIPGSQTLGVVGQTSQFIAIGSYNVSPTSANLTSSVTWESSDTSVATVSNATATAGLVTAVGVGSATITALATSPDGSVLSATSTVSVSSAQTARTLSAVTVTPGAETLTAVGQTAQFDAIGTYTAIPFTQDVTASATWTSSQPSVATVNSSGLVTVTGVGSTTITAYSAGDGVVSGTATLTVTPVTSGRVLTSLTLIPTTQTVGEVGETAQFLAIGTYSTAPLTADLTNQVTWVSSDVQVATINNAGLATTVGIGTTSIAALATASDGSVVAANGTLQWPSTQNDTGGTTLPTLTIYGAGQGSGTVVGTDAGTTANPISCSYSGPSTGTPGAQQASAGCTGTFPAGTVVTLTATPAAGTVFDGWSSNCTVGSSANVCTVTVSGNISVGAIFDPQ